MEFYSSKSISVGLTWDDIDFEEKSIYIKQAGQYLPRIGNFDKKTKTTSSMRIISLPQTIIDLLKEYKVWQNNNRLNLGELWQNKNKIFTLENGKPISYNTPSKWFKQFLKKQNLPEITFHQLRHTNATLLVAQGVDIKTVSNRLGHTKASTTTDIYECVKLGRTTFTKYFSKNKRVRLYTDALKRLILVYPNNFYSTPKNLKA